MSRIQIDIGERPASEYCGRCPLLRVRRFGSVFSCGVFRTSEELRETPRFQLVRWPECIQAEVEVEGEGNDNAQDNG